MTGKADVDRTLWRNRRRPAAAGGTGIALYKGSIYAEINDRIVRYALPAGSIVPQGPATTVVSGLPLGGDHPMHPFAITADGSMYVDVGTATNSCQLKNRTLKSPGADPCTELETRGGIWRFDANKTNQPFTPADRYATGIRNGEGFAIDAAGKRVYVTQHGRDQLHANWPDLYKPEEEATLPAEELLLLKQGGDYGWPECYYDPLQRKLVLAPEYGGDGGKKVGVCANKIAPVAAFPAHWAPNGVVFYDQKQFPAHYRDGVFIAFHGSWDRAPYPQGGYNVVFQPLSGDRASGPCEIFADGFAGAGQVSGEGRASSQRARRWTRWIALYLRRHDRADLSRHLCGWRLGRRWRQIHSLPRAYGSGRRDRASRGQTAGRHAPRRRPSPFPGSNAGDGGPGRSHLSRPSGRSIVRGLPWRER